MNKNPRFAGLGIRFLALLLDLLIFCAVFFPVTRLTKGVWIIGSSGHRWRSGLFITDPLCLVFLAVMVLYFILFEGLAGATPGKQAAGIRVVRVEGGKPGIGRALTRNILRIVDGLPALNILGVLLIARSREKARFGDRIAGTRVIRVRPE